MKYIRSLSWILILGLWLIVDIVTLFIPSQCRKNSGKSDCSEIQKKPYLTLFHIYAYVDLVLLLCLHIPVALYLIRRDQNWFLFGPGNTLGSWWKVILFFVTRLVQSAYTITIFAWDAITIYRLVVADTCLQHCAFIWGLVTILAFHGLRIAIIVACEVIKWICTPPRSDYHPIATYDTETTDMSGFYN
jgi:hypothetical protein